MYSLQEFDHEVRVIMHFLEDEILGNQSGRRVVYYQVTITPDEEQYSPCGQFIRFDHKTSEVHGWVLVESVVVDTVLETLSDAGEWRVTANG